MWRLFIGMIKIGTDVFWKLCKLMVFVKGHGIKKNGDGNTLIQKRKSLIKNNLQSDGIFFGGGLRIESWCFSRSKSKSKGYEGYFWYDFWSTLSIRIWMRSLWAKLHGICKDMLEYLLMRVLRLEWVGLQAEIGWFSCWPGGWKRVDLGVEMGLKCVRLDSEMGLTWPRLVAEMGVFRCLNGGWNLHVWVLKRVGLGAEMGEFRRPINGWVSLLLIFQIIYLIPLFNNI